MRIGRWALGALLVALLGYAGALVFFESAEPDVRFEAVPQDPFAGGMPAGFLWGASTAAHQIEGGNTLNDWARFEEVAGNIRGGERSGLAVDHWNRVAEDTGLLRDLGANAYRFSIEWSRLEPEPGRWDEEAWGHYVDEVAQLRAAGIEPMVTLLHFTLPGWMADRGGLTADDFAERFAAFAGEAARRLGDQVALWCTVNEPNVQMYQGYVAGIWPPGVQDSAAASRAFTGLVRGHALAAAAVRAADADARVGAAINLIVFDPQRRWWLPDWIGAREADLGFNWAFYDSIQRGAVTLKLAGFPAVDEPVEGLLDSADWFGLNYYRRNMVRFSPGEPGLVQLLPGPGPLTDTGIEVYPEGLLRLMRRVWQRYGLPIIVTENGVADDDGDLRAAYLRDHAFAVASAVAEGIPVQGYFYWSLTDNFEWAEGFDARFGLYRIDYATLARHEGPGATEFRRLAALLR